MQDSNWVSLAGLCGERGDVYIPPIGQNLLLKEAVSKTQFTANETLCFTRCRKRRILWYKQRREFDLYCDGENIKCL